jgi:hypothetical protein
VSRKKAIVHSFPRLLKWRSWHRRDAVDWQDYCVSPIATAPEAARRGCDARCRHHRRRNPCLDERGLARRRHGFRAAGLGLTLLVSIFVNAVIPAETRSEIADRLSTVPVYYFIVAFLSGLAGTFAFFWPRIVEALAGIAISVALIPPVVMLGIGIAELSRELMQGSAKIVALNIIGMALSAYIATATLAWYARD